MAGLMKTLAMALAALAAVLALAVPARALPRLEIGPLSRGVELPGLRACYAAHLPGDSGVGFRFLTDGSSIFLLDGDGHLSPLMDAADLFGAVSDPEQGILLCTSRGVFATSDGVTLRQLSTAVFSHVIAAPVGGLFARPGEGLYGFDGEQFQLVRSIPWSSIESMAVETAPGGTVWFVGTYTRPDGSEAPSRLYVSRDRNGQPVIEDPFPGMYTASAVAEYFGGIVVTLNGHLQGTIDSGVSWAPFDDFGRTDLTLTSVPLYEGLDWEALWIGVRDVEGGPAPLWFDDYLSGIVDQPINASQVLQVTADLSRRMMLFVADGALFEASYRIVDDDSPNPPN